MLIDNQLMYSDAQDLQSTAASTNYVDHGVNRVLGAGERMFVVLVFGTVVSNATLSAALEGADDTGFSSNKITIAQGKTITPTSTTMYAFPIPVATPKRYTRMYYTMSGGSSPHIPTTATLVKDTEVHLSSISY